MELNALNGPWFAMLNYQRVPKFQTPVGDRRFAMAETRNSRNRKPGTCHWIWSFWSFFAGFIWFSYFWIIFGYALLHDANHVYVFQFLVRQLHSFPSEGTWTWLDMARVTSVYHWADLRLIWPLQHLAALVANLCCWRNYNPSGRF